MNYFGALGKSCSAFFALSMAAVGHIPILVQHIHENESASIITSQKPRVGYNQLL